MQILFHDIRYAIRMLRKSPGFTAVAIITLALGIGANTAVFSVVYGVLLRPLPYPRFDRLVVMRNNQSRLDMDDVRERTKTLERGGAFTLQSMDFTGGVEPLQIHAALIDGGLFSILEVKPLLGRTLRPDEDRIGGPLHVVLSHAFWQQHLGGDPNVIGKSIPLSGRSYTVIGVMPADFSLPNLDVDGFISLRVAYPEGASYRGVHFMRSYWRLKPGVTLAQAQAEMPGIDGQLAELYPDEDKERHTELVPLKEWVVGQTRTPLLVLFGAVGFVLLVACANFANLLVTRAVSRRSEMVVRAALGAGRKRLITQMLTESVLVAMLGGAAGLVLANFGLDFLLALKPANLPRISVIALYWRVFLFALSASLATGLVFGLVPAWATLRTDPVEALNEAGRGGSAGVGSHRLRSLLIVGEVSLALLLLTGAGLLIKGFWLLRSTDPGFSPEHVLAMNLQLPESRYPQIPKQTQFRRQVLEGLSALPGVEAAMVSEVPLSGDLVTHNFVIEGRPPLAVGTEPETDSRSVMGDYFRVMRIPLRAGRYFTAQDHEGVPLVGIINRAMARQFFPKQNPIGARIRWAHYKAINWITIVGVVGDVKHLGLDQAEDPAVYTPYAQSTEPWKRWMTLVVRTHQEPAAVVKATKNVIRSIDSQIPLGDVHTMNELMTESTAERQFNMLLLGLFAGLALALAAVGIYGLTSYSVTQRTHEIGIRMALGANRSHVMKLVVGQGMLLAGLGVAIGLIAAVGLTRLMASMLFAVRPTDPATFAAVAGLLVGVALAASVIPARRATKVDPMVALRYE
jgi:putative ABC transport system permease protein